MKLLSIAVISLLAIAPVRGVKQLESAAGSVEGVVMRAGSGEPLAGARVTLTPVTVGAGSGSSGQVVSGTVGGIPADLAVVSASSSNISSIPQVTTEADGRFVFRNLGSGLYGLHVLCDGYARQSYGQRTIGGSATAIRLGAGQSVRNIVMSLIPAGNISGVIRGMDGRPKAGVPVQLLRSGYNSGGQRVFQVEGTTRTNDRGEYRMYWMTPGRYSIAAGTPTGPSRPINPAAASGNPNEISGRSFSLVFYPGVGDPRGAGLLEISPGAELTGIDFSVTDQGLHRLSGRILDAATGQPPPAVSLSLSYRTLTGNSGAFNAGEKYDPMTGAFELRNVPSGNYVVQAIASDGAAVEGEALLRIAPLATRPNARVPVEVTNSDLDGVLLTLTSGVDLPGRITVDGMSLSSLRGWERIRVSLKPALDSAFGPNLQPSTPVSRAPGPDGAFVVNGVSAGEFAVGPIAGLPSGLYLKEARFNGADVLGQTLRFSGVVSGPLEIVLSAKAGQVEGTAVDARSSVVAGARLVLVPDRRNRADLFKTAVSDSSGHFLVRNVAPGDYRAFVWEALEAYAYFDPDVVRQADPFGVLVHVSDSSSNNITVRVIPAKP